MPLLKTKTMAQNKEFKFKIEEHRQDGTQIFLSHWKTPGITNTLDLNPIELERLKVVVDQAIEKLKIDVSKIKEELLQAYMFNAWSSPKDAFNSILDDNEYPEDIVIKVHREMVANNTYANFGDKVDKLIGEMAKEEEQEEEEVWGKIGKSF